ncbi:MAG: nucleotidyltransferase domain-containing protein [Anaerolineales bacterium]
MSVNLMNIPGPKRLLLELLVGRLSGISGMAAVVLGGSYAGGSQHETSDLDVGLYYREATPFSIVEIRRVADGVSAKGPATVTDFYE